MAKPSLVVALVPLMVTSPLTTDPHAAFRGNLVNRLLIFQQRPAIEFHILVHLQRAISRIWRQYQLFALAASKRRCS